MNDTTKKQQLIDNWEPIIHFYSQKKNDQAKTSESTVDDLLGLFDNESNMK